MIGRFNRADRDFLEAMIAHHEEALRMARSVIQHGSDVTVDEMAKRILQVQTKEIERMRSMLA
jgi:uncharacterized protein (DUF305 family)